MKTFQIFISLVATILLIIFCQSLGHTQQDEPVKQEEKKPKWQDILDIYNEQHGTNITLYDE
jgi:hypothetical protein